MEFTAHQVKKRQAAARIIILGCVLGILYPLVFYKFPEKQTLLSGLLTGLSGSILIVIFEYGIFNPQSRKFSFLAVFLMKTILYFLSFTLVVLFIKGLTDSLFSQANFSETIRSEKFRHFIFQEDFDFILIYTLITLSVIVFNIQISRKFGYDVLISFITGKYYKPVEEDRIFMYIDIKSSTTITDKIGDFKYHQLLNDLYFDFTRAVLTADGTIYRYVGDEMAVTWKLEKGLKNANCIRAYFYIRYIMKKEKEKYYNKYGFIPQFSTSYHSGKVVVSEIGQIKTQIVFNGEPPIITSIVEKECSRLNKPVLITSDLLDQLQLPPVYRSVKAGHIQIGPLNRKLDLYTIEEYEETEAVS
jgi:adenylate cyclase